MQGIAVKGRAKAMVSRGGALIGIAKAMVSRERRCYGNAQMEMHSKGTAMRSMAVAMDSDEKHGNGDV